MIIRNSIIIFDKFDGNLGVTDPAQRMRVKLIDSRPLPESPDSYRDVSRAMAFKCGGLDTLGSYSTTGILVLSCRSIEASDCNKVKAF